MNQVKEVDQGGIAALENLDAQIVHEPVQGHPEVIPHHDDALDVLAVALAQGPGQFGILLAPVGV